MAAQPLLPTLSPLDPRAHPPSSARVGRAPKSRGFPRDWSRVVRGPKHDTRAPDADADDTVDRGSGGTLPRDPRARRRPRREEQGGSDQSDRPQSTRVSGATPACRGYLPHGAHPPARDSRPDALHRKIREARPRQPSCLGSGRRRRVDRLKSWRDFVRARRRGRKLNERRSSDSPRGWTRCPRRGRSTASPCRTRPCSPSPEQARCPWR